MPTIDLNLDGDGAFPELTADIAAGALIHLGNDSPPIKMAVLPEGMSSGRPSIAFVFRLPDGRAVFIETSLRLPKNAARRPPA